MSKDSNRTTHIDDCYKWHHACAIAQLEELKEQVDGPRGYIAKIVELQNEVSTLKRFLDERRVEREILFRVIKSLDAKKWRKQYTKSEIEKLFDKAEKET